MVSNSIQRTSKELSPIAPSSLQKQKKPQKEGRKGGRKEGKKERKSHLPDMLRTEFGVPLSEGRSMSGRWLFRGRDLELRVFKASNPQLQQLFFYKSQYKQPPTQRKTPPHRSPTNANIP